MTTLSAFLLTLGLSLPAWADEEGALSVTPVEDAAELDSPAYDVMRAPLLDLTPRIPVSEPASQVDLGGNVIIEGRRPQLPADCTVARDACMNAAVVTVPLGKRDGDAPASVNPGDSAATLQQMARREQQRRALDSVLDDLQLAWAYGEPMLAGEGPAATPHDRRQAILRYWAAQPPTPHGDARRAVVEEFLALVVQPSPWPVTQQEADVAQATCGCGDRLELPGL